MSTKEEFKERVRNIQETGQQAILRHPGLVRWAEHVIRALLSGILAGAEIAGDFAPFGLGMVAASGSGLGGFCSLIGACFGYIAFRGFMEGLPYAATCILIFAVAFAFYDVKLCRQNWFMPTIAVLLGGMTGFVYRSNTFTDMKQVIGFAAELVLIAISAYCDRQALSSWESRGEEVHFNQRQKIGLFVFLCTVLVAFAQVYILREISLGCIAGVLICMAAAWKGGIGIGTAAGVCVGLTMDLALGQNPKYAIAYGFAAVLAGALRKQSKLAMTIAYVLGNGIIVFWGWGIGFDISALYEVFIASVIFMVLPERILQYVEDVMGGELNRKERGEDRSRIYAKEKLEYTADAFRELYDTLRTSFRRVAPNDGDISTVFHRAANKVCVLCALRDHCWQREFAATMNALNDGLPAMAKRGRGEMDDFPVHFRTKCLNFPTLLAIANEELTALKYRRQYQSRARESREAVCRQYGLFASTLDDVARRLNQEQVRDIRRERRICRRLTSMDVQSSVWYDPNGHLLLEIWGAQIDALKSEEERKRLSRIMEVPLGEAEEVIRNGVTYLRWRQAEPFMAVAGVSACKKEGQTVSGDAGAWFKGEDGCLYVLLCDGMGSGTEANRESTLAIRLLEKFLRAGMDPEEALNTLSAALALREERDGGFTTVDLFQLDLFTGEAGFYKLGAAPTYVRRKGMVNKVTGNALPAGLHGDSKPDVSKMRLEAGDSVVMISDGVACTQEDAWVKEALAVYDGKDPKSLAGDLIEKSGEHEGVTDDRTAVVLTVKRR